MRSRATEIVEGLVRRQIDKAFRWLRHETTAHLIELDVKVAAKGEAAALKANAEASAEPAPPPPPPPAAPELDSEGAAASAISDALEADLYPDQTKAASAAADEPPAAAAASATTSADSATVSERAMLRATTTQILSDMEVILRTIEPLVRIGGHVLQDADVVFSGLAANNVWLYIAWFSDTCESVAGTFMRQIRQVRRRRLRILIQTF